jgi:hypothetical protein
MSLLLASAAAVLLSSVQVPEPFAGRPVFDRLLRKSQAFGWKKLPVGELMGKVGWELRGTPYVGFTAERWVDREVCSIDLTGMDCVTFYENCLAFARMVKKGKQRPEDMLAEVELTRYRKGIRGDYTTRVHYTSDWLFDNSVKGTVDAITPTLPGVKPFRHKVGYMTAHPDRYRQLARFPELVPVIKSQEDAINSRDNAHVPADAVDGVESLLRTGDILGFTTSKEGLDTSHTGFVLRHPGGVGVLHASLSQKAVVFEPDLSDFVRSFANGIMVGRPLEP